ncbi:MAG: outer membrane beta-barrel protein [Bacteroidota bacterium]
MKKLLMIATLVAVCSLTANAQEQGDIRATVSVIYGLDIEEAGLNIGGEYLITDKIAAGANYSTYFTPEGLSASEINIDGRYYFSSAGPQLYGLLGLGIHRTEFDLGGFGSFSASDSGLNVGFGALFPLADKIGIRGQAKYTIGGFEQLVLQGGVTFMF